MFWEKYGNTNATDVLAPCVAKPSVATICGVSCVHIILAKLRRWFQHDAPDRKTLWILDSLAEKKKQVEKRRG